MRKCLPHQSFLIISIAYLCCVPSNVWANTNHSSAGMQGNDVFVSMLIEYEADLVDVSDAVEQALSVRLARFGVEIDKRSFLGKSTSAQKYHWNVTLRRISERHLIVTIDSTDKQRSASEVRTVSNNPEVESLAWTIALVVEETVTPYLQTEGELPALGTGLAILEPREVGGTKAIRVIHKTTYPRFQSLGLGLTVSSIWSINEIIMGPKIFLMGRFSRRTIAAFAFGWAGSAQFGDGEVSGAMSQIPIELYFGTIFLKKRRLRIVGWAGVSLGFSIYKTQSHGSSRTDMTFQPGANLLLELASSVAKPLEVFLQGGANFPFVRDILVNNTVEVYSHVWVMPILTLGLRLRF